MAPVLAIIALIIVGGVAVHSLSTGPALAPLERTIRQGTFTVADPTSQFRIDYRVGAPTTITGYAFITQAFSGSARDNGRSLAVSYLDPQSYQIMQNRYGSIDRCPASFLNQYTRVLQVFVASPDQHAQLLALADKSPNAVGAVPFTVSGQQLSAATIQLADGSRRLIDFGPDTLILLSSVE